MLVYNYFKLTKLLKYFYIYVESKLVKYIFINSNNADVEATIFILFNGGTVVDLVLYLYKIALAAYWFKHDNAIAAIKSYDSVLFVITVTVGISNVELLNE